MSDERMNGAWAAGHLAEALYELGFPWDQIGDVGLRFAKKLEVDSDIEHDVEFISGVRDEFEGIKADPPQQKTPTFESRFGPSEYTVIEKLIEVMDDFAGSMPWAAEPIYDLLDEYDEYLKAVNAPERLKERSFRIRHSVSDIEDKASGRG